RYLVLIIALISAKSAKEDGTSKKTLYERTFRTAEYFCYDPETEQLEGWRLGPRQRYRAIPPNERGWREAEEVGLWLGTWRGLYQGYEAVWLRFFDADGPLVPTPPQA